MCLKFVSPGSLGVPDRIIITASGKIIFAELKTDTGRLSKLQQQMISEMQKGNADVRILQGLQAVRELLNEIGSKIFFLTLQYCINSIIYNRAVGLMLDMGLGKTVITLTAIKDLRYNRWEISKPLIIAPKKVAEATWTTEAKKLEHLKGLRIVQIMGTLQQRLKALATPADIYVINRENTQWLVEYLKNNWNFDMVVIDESSSFKNSRSKRFKALKLVRSRIKRIVELTGMPASSGLEDLWAQIYLPDGGARLERTLGAYRDKYFLPDRRNRMVVFSYKPKQGSFEIIKNKIKDICISMKAEDYLALPEMIYNDVPVVLNSSVRQAYQSLEKDFLLDVKNGIITAGSAGVLTGKLL